MTEEQINEIVLMKTRLPFRIVWGMLHKDTYAFSVHAHYTKRQMNKAVRDGHYVVKAQN
jgi:hypothetical protein